MRALTILLAIGALAASGAAVWYLEPFADDSDQASFEELEALDPELAGSGCRRLAGVAARLAHQGGTPVRFLRELGRQVAGIRPPPRGYGDLARGGRNRVSGRGFLARYDDGTEGQPRHFAGIAVATTFVGGGSVTRWLSENVRQDPAGSPDGRLTDEGVAFARAVLSGELALAEAPAWLLENLCRRR